MIIFASWALSFDVYRPGFENKVMLASFQRLKNLIARPAHEYRSGPESFPDLDVQRIAADMKLAARGRRRGEEDQPPSDALTYDSVETEILETIGAAQKRANDQLSNNLAGFAERLTGLDFEGRFAAFKAISASGLSELKAELQKGIDRLHGLRRDLGEAETWRTKFRERNDLERPCHVTTMPGTVVRWLIIVAVVFVELLLNGELLSKTNNLGLVGGVFEALVFATLNVAAALIAALYGVPQILHRKSARKLIGLIALVAYLAFMVVLNLGLAHYREVAGAVQDGAGEQVMRSLLSAPLALQDFRSWLLFALGIIFSVVAFIDGWHMKETYPGYGTVDRRVRKDRANYLDMREYLIDELRGVRTEIEDELTDARSSLGKQRTEHDSIVAHRNRLVTLFEDYQNQLEKAANALLQTYRDANTAARKTPAPNYFQQAYRINMITVPVVTPGELNPDELKASILSVQSDLDQLLVAVGAQFDDALGRYSPVDNLVQGT